jgi:hypothetical protein
MTEGDTQSPSSSRPWYLWAGLVALGLAALVVVAIAVRPDSQDDYDDAVRDRFLAACTTDGGEPVRNTCVCLYDAMVANVPFDRFELLDESLAAETQDRSDAPLELPDDVQAMLDECVAAAAPASN